MSLNKISWWRLHFVSTIHNVCINATNAKWKLHRQTTTSNYIRFGFHFPIMFLNDRELSATKAIELISSNAAANQWQSQMKKKFKAEIQNNPRAGSSIITDSCHYVQINLINTKRILDSRFANLTIFFLLFFIIFLQKICTTTSRQCFALEWYLVSGVTFFFALSYDYPMSTNQVDEIF